MYVTRDYRQRDCDPPTRLRAPTATIVTTFAAASASVSPPSPYSTQAPVARSRARRARTRVPSVSQDALR